jgi:hypothetical protein
LRPTDTGESVTAACACWNSHWFSPEFSVATASDYHRLNPAEG